MMVLLVPIMLFAVFGSVLDAHYGLVLPMVSLGLLVGVCALLAYRRFHQSYTRLREQADVVRQGLLESHESLKLQFHEQTGQLRRSYKNYEQLVQSANSIILRWDTEGIIRFMNPYALEFFGFSEHEIIGHSVLDTIVPATEVTGRDLVYMIDDICRNPEDYKHNENQNIKKDGSRAWIAWTNKAVMDERGRKIEILSIGNDITDKKVYEQQIHSLAHYDTLTGLPNRILFMKRLNEEMQAARTSGRVLPVMYLDLDRFKTINDSLGHDLGDLLLEQLAHRFDRCLSETETLSRMSGDEFAVILDNEADNDSAFDSVHRKANHLLSVIREPFSLNGHQIFVTGSIGIVLFPTDGMQAEVLLKNADMAMYQAKSQGNDCFVFYESYMNERIMQRLQLENAMREAIDTGSMGLVYQPTINLQTLRVESVEALLRWHHPELGEVTPEQFIPVAEDTGMIIELGSQVVKNAISQAATWYRAGFTDINVAVNLSLRQVHQPGLVDLIEQVLQEHELPASMFGLEITESTIMQDSEQGMSILNQLHELGIRLYIDDFGTGYSSLARLRDMPIHSLKIDRSFVSEEKHMKNNARIIDAIIAMAHSLNIKVIAEGVETAAQLCYLKRRQCEYAQGFYLAQPCDVYSMQQFLQQGISLQQDENEAVPV